MPKIIQLYGKEFGRFLVVSSAGQNKHHEAMWNCICSCGTKKVVASQSLRKGTTQSCGCMRNERLSALNRSHGKYLTYTYRIWAGMRSRCNNPRAPFYTRYGGSGINICERWNSFENFITDLGEREKGYSLDRIDSGGNYCPENCRWVLAKEQAKNRRRPINNTSGTKGVKNEHGKWAVVIGLDYKRHRFGVFDDLELAELVAFEARRRLHGEYANHS